MEENLSVKKTQAQNQSNLGQAMNASLNLIDATGTFCLNLFKASFKAAFQFNRDALHELSSLNQSTSDNLQSIVDANQRFFQKTMQNTQNTFKEQAPGNTEDAAKNIDYQLLAKMVAEELGKRGKK